MQWQKFKVVFGVFKESLDTFIACQVFWYHYVQGILKIICVKFKEKNSISIINPGRLIKATMGFSAKIDSSGYCL